MIDSPKQLERATVIEMMKNNTELLDAVNFRLDILKAFFNSTNIKIDVTKTGFNYNDTIEVTSIHESKELQILKTFYHKKDIVYTDHKHVDSIEYLIVAKGQIAVRMGRDIVRVVNQGECASIPIGLVHSVVALVDETELWVICIPPEFAYAKGNI